MRAHVLEGPLGKLAEEYEPSVRVVLGQEHCNGLGGRIRYWHYSDHLRNLNLPSGGTRFDWDVVDWEVTKRFQFSRTDLIFAGGVRWADVALTGFNTLDDTDLIGLTMAADLNTLLCCRCSSYVSAIYGGRLSILGGDWNFRGATMARDDTVVVHELYGGFEYGCSHCGFDLYSQLKFEMQSWRSDYMTSAFGANISFVGPAFTFGVGF